MHEHLHVAYCIDSHLLWISSLQAEIFQAWSLYKGELSYNEMEERIGE